MEIHKRNITVVLCPILAFLVPSLLMFLVYALRSTYPFGDNSALVLDLNAQYVYYYESYRDAFFGDSSLFYSFSRTLGGEMAGIFAYYLASPFMLVLLLFPKVMITEAVLTIILLKIGASGLTFYLFIRKQRDGGKWSTLLFSTMYALMSYMTVQTLDPMWLDALVLLPLIAISTERFIKSGAFGLLCAELTVLFIANFYIGYMTGIFVFAYFLYVLFRDKPESMGFAIKKTLGFLGVALLSVLMCAWLLAPTVYSLSFGKFTFSDPNFIPEQQLDFFDLLSKTLPFVYDSVNYQGQPFIYCGTLSLLLCVQYFFNPGINARRKLAAGAFIGLFIASFTISTLDIVLHGFQAPNWLNYRYSFILSFLMVVLASEAFESKQPLEAKNIVKAAAPILIVFLVISHFKYEYIRTELSVWIGIAALCVYSLLVFLLKKYLNPNPYDFGTLRTGKHDKAKLRTAAVFLAVLVAAEATGNSFAMLYGADEEVSYSTRSSYRDYFDRLYPAVDFINESDKSFFRAESIMRRTVNDPMALKLRGISHSSSTLNSTVIDFLHDLGFSSKEHWTRYMGPTPLSNSVLGIKYLLAEEPPGDLYRRIYSEDGVEVYENPEALPVAYAADRDILTMTLDGDDPFMNQNKLLSTLLGRMYTEYFKLATIDQILFENMSSTQYDGYVSYKPIKKGQNAHIEYKIATAGENEIYMYLVSPYHRKANVWLDGKFVTTYFDYDTVCILSLGAHPTRDNFSVITTPTEDEYYLSQNMFYYLDTQLYCAGISDLSEGTAEVEHLSDTHLKIRSSLDDDQVLFTTIPYDKGWTVRVDGRKKDAVRTETGLLAIETGNGEHEVELTFVPYGFIPGLFISVAAAAVFILILLLRRRIIGRKAAVPAITAVEESDETTE